MDYYTDLDRERMSWYCRRQKDGSVVGANVQPAGLNPPTLRVLSQRGGDWEISSDTGMSVSFTINSEDHIAKLTWDKSSTGWKAKTAADNPSSISWAWEVNCLFPRPANVNDMTIKVYKEPPMPLLWAPE